MKFFKRLFLTLLFLLITSIAFSPHLLSTKIGNKFLTKIFIKKTKYPFHSEKMHFSWFGPQRIEGLKFSTKNIDVYVESFSSDIGFIKLITLINQKNIFSLNAKSDIKNANIVIKYPNFTKAHLTNIFGSTNLVNQKLILKLQGKTILLNKTGSFDINASYDKKNITGTCNFLNFPSITLDEIISLYNKRDKGFLTKLLGDNVNLKTSFNISDEKGPINLDISSENLKTTIFANYFTNLITFRKPIIANFILTKDFSSFLSKEENPNLIYSKNPIKIQIAPEGLLLPINPFALKELSIDNAYLDLGKLKAQNRGKLRLIMSAMTQKAFNSEEIEIWCGPVEIQIKNGTLYISRMDMLIDRSIHICTWGYIDLIKDKVKMTLGITAQALNYSFGITNLPKNYVLQIPIRGSLTDIKIDTSQAAYKIAALKAIKIQDNIFSQIIDLLKQKYDDQSNVPAPRRPFPWER